MVIDGGQTNVHNKECLGSYVSWDLKRWGLKKAFERLGISQLINCAYNFLYSYCCGGVGWTSCATTAVMGSLQNSQGHMSQDWERTIIVPCGFQKSDLISTLGGGVFHCQPQPVQCEHFQRAAWTKGLFRQYSLFKPRLQLTTNEWILEGFYYLELENTQRGDNSSFLYPSLDYIGLGNLDRTGGITSQLPLRLKNNNKMTLIN